MFTKENGKTFLVVLAAVMVGLAVHQRFVAPRIKK
jgi:nitrogen fixation/metabolism regulation signal transduction histidine kinase